MGRCWVRATGRRCRRAHYNGQVSSRPCSTTFRNAAHLSVSFALVWVFFRFGVGMRHSMEKAVQLVQGTPRLAASHRT